MGRRGNARLGRAASREGTHCHDDRIDRIRRGVDGARVGTRRACRRSRPLRCRTSSPRRKSACWIFSPARSRPGITPGAARRSASRARSASGATIIGTGTLASPGDAAFANATMGHGLVREDMHAASICHHGVVIWPTLLALSERTALSGTTFLAAAIIGYETGAQIGRALVHRRPRPPLPADRSRRAARRSVGGKLCPRPRRRCRNQRASPLPPIHRPA